MFDSIAGKRGMERTHLIRMNEVQEVSGSGLVNIHQVGKK